MVVGRGVVGHAGSVHRGHGRERTVRVALHVLVQLHVGALGRLARDDTLNAEGVLARVQVVGLLQLIGEEHALVKDARVGQSAAGRVVEVVHVVDVCLVVVAVLLRVVLRVLVVVVVVTALLQLALL